MQTQNPPKELTQATYFKAKGKLHPTHQRLRRAT